MNAEVKKMLTRLIVIHPANLALLSLESHGQA
jgi:hypothetical protein